MLKYILQSTFKIFRPNKFGLRPDIARIYSFHHKPQRTILHLNLFPSQPSHYSQDSTKT